MAKKENKKVSPAALDDDMLEGVVGGTDLTEEEYHIELDRLLNLMQKDLMQKGEVKLSDIIDVISGSPYEHEVMELLIHKISELLTTDRERALNLVNATVRETEEKIAEMEADKEQQYEGAIEEAVGTPINGVDTVGMSGMTSGASMKSLKGS